MRALIGADVLKLVKRRGLMIAAVAIIVGLPVVVVTIAAIGRAVSPATFGRFGGGGGYEVVTGILAFGLFVVTILLGAVAGTADESRGVFRDLVATGVSRPRLALARIPAVVAVVVPLALVTFVVALAVGSLAEGDEAMPGAQDLLRDGVYVLVVISVYAALAVGLSSLTGSLSISLTAMFTWFVIIEPILASISLLGDARRLLLSPALTAINRPGARLDEDDIFGLSAGGGLVIVALWVAAFTAFGVWRVAHRDA